MKIGDKLYQWVFLHARNGEQFAGLVEVPEDLKIDDKQFKRCLAADLLQPKVKHTTAIKAEGGPEQVVTEEIGAADRIIELRNPHQVIMQAGGGKQILTCLPLNLGDKLIFLRAGEIMFAQLLDEKSPIVVDIRAAVSGIVDPTAKAGEQRTDGGIILPGAPQP